VCSRFCGVLLDNGRIESAGRENRDEAGTFRRFRYDTAGLRGKRLRLLDDLPTSDAGHLQEALIGITEVICLDETPNVMHDLRVHPVGQPETVARVEFRQLALYEQ
jgi:hypothetical protein